MEAKAKCVISVAASLLLVAGCSAPDKKTSATSSGSETSTTSTTSQSSSASATSTSTATSSTSESPSTSATSSTSASPSTSDSAVPTGAKETFCRDVNTAVNITQTAGPTLTEAQTTDMTAALQTASTGAPSDVPVDFAGVITAMIADLQAPTNDLPDSWNPNAEKLARYAAEYCG